MMLPPLSLRSNRSVWRMAVGGVSFFPLKVTGTLPTAAAGDLITYPARPFDGEKANAGNCLGAFYTWPSPMGRWWLPDLIGDLCH